MDPLLDSRSRRHERSLSHSSRSMPRLIMLCSFVCASTLFLLLYAIRLVDILVPALHYGCEVWGMHTPTGEAKAARATLQSIYDRFLRRISKDLDHSKSPRGKMPRSEGNHG